MTDAEHIKAFRLFERAQAAASGKDFHLRDSEDQHLQGCNECQEVLAVFARLFRQRPPSLADMPHNGELNSKGGIYKNLCCGFEVYVPAGKVFPDCRRHTNLPTVWKKTNDDPIPRAADLNKKRSA
jgi:hypothetical protein